MRRHIGEEFDARISGVTDFGLFVVLDANAVEGLVHVSTLGDDYYSFDAASHALTGEGSGRRFRLGDSIRVRLIEVRREERKIDFEAVLPEAQGTPARHRRGRGKRGSRG